MCCIQQLKQTIRFSRTVETRQVPFHLVMVTRCDTEMCTAHSAHKTALHTRDYKVYAGLHHQVFRIVVAAPTSSECGFNRVQSVLSRFGAMAKDLSDTHGPVHPKFQ